MAPRVPFGEHAERVLEVVASIPAGRVMAYGDVGRALGDRGPRYVGNVMAGYASDLPWWRVVRADGSLAKGARQRALLEAEDVPFTAAGRVDMRIARMAGP